MTDRMKYVISALLLIGCDAGMWCSDTQCKRIALFEMCVRRSIVSDVVVYADVVKACQEAASEVVK